MQPSFCCTQQRLVLMIWRHCEGEQHAAVPDAEAMHVSPARVQSLHTPPEQELPPQQSESAVHDWPLGRHAQRPPTQVIEPQQSAEVMHVAFDAAHAQWPLVHAAPLQHSAPDEQAPPARLQQVPVVPPVPLHEIDAPDPLAQQRVPVAPDEHAMPGDAHIVVPPSPPLMGDVHVPLRHSRPDAQSEFAVHPPPAALRAQWPERHESEPQHSSSEVHAPDSARQQRVAPCELEHIVPIAHAGIDPGVHAPPAGTGVLVPSTQVPDEHVRPEQHALDAEHAEPAPLQWRQRPPTHWSEGLVHSEPDVQQRCPSLPHTGVVDISQRRGVPVLHVSPGSHAAVPQHAWPIDPQAVPMPGWHVPLMHERPALQALVPQHISPSPPQLAPGPVPPSVPPPDEAAQVPLRQVAPGLHASEPQQGWPTSPQGPGVPPPPGPGPGPVPASVPPAPLELHTPPMHEKPALQATPPQQVSPLPPHGAGMPPERRTQLPR